MPISRLSGDKNEKQQKIPKNISKKAKKVLTIGIICDIIFKSQGADVSNSSRITRQAQDLGVAQLVARYLGVVEAASSSLVTQTKQR